MMTVSEAPVRRIEVFTGAGRRRTWPSEVKLQIVAESLSGLESVCSVARRHGLTATQLFSWRKQARIRNGPPALAFAPVVIDEGEPPPPAPKPRTATRRGRTATIELEIDGVVVRVARGAEARTVAAVITPVKAVA